jgi:hypothetical protein
MTPPLRRYEPRSPSPRQETRASFFLKLDFQQAAPDAGAVIKRSIVLLTFLAVVVVASPTPAATGSLRGAALVGRWERVTTCQALVASLTKAGLRKTAPAMLAGNGLVSGTPKQLAHKPDICKGAAPRRHSHFFTSSGQFGSVDYNGKQVDDGTYRLLDARTVRINDGTFHFRISGRKLRLSPVISAAARRKALARPLQFSTAGWQVAVAFPGHAWKHVSCNGWC